ncbi:hypothetical protein [Thermococcus sp.]
MDVKAKLLFSSAFFLWFIQEFYLLQTGGSRIFHTHYLLSVLLVLILTLLLFLALHLYRDLNAEKPAFFMLSLYFLFSLPLFWSLKWLMAFDAFLFLLAFLSFVTVKRNVGGWNSIRANSGGIVLFLTKISVVFFLLYFLPGNLLSYDIGECPMFGAVVYNTPCRLYSLGMFSLGISILSLLLAGRIRVFSILSAFYFGITFFEAWAWVISARLFALAGLVLSLILFVFSPREAGASRSLSRAVGLVLYVFNFAVFLLMAVSFVFYFSWICDGLYSSSSAPLCLTLSYALIILGIASPVLWAKGRKNCAVIILLVNFLFFGIVLRPSMSGWTPLSIALSIVALALNSPSFTGGFGRSKNGG